MLMYKVEREDIYMTTVLKIFGIICMIVCILFILSMIFIPDKLVKFLKKHERIQLLVSIMFHVGLISVFISVMY